MKFIIRFKISNRLSKGSSYTLKELCLNIVDRYSLTERELAIIVTLQKDEVFANSDLEVKRIK